MNHYHVFQVCHYALLGGCVAPVLVLWYRWLDRRLPGGQRETRSDQLLIELYVDTETERDGDFKMAQNTFN